jgi:hypothetical protein
LRKPWFGQRNRWGDWQVTQTEQGCGVQGHCYI